MSLQVEVYAILIMRIHHTKVKGDIGLSKVIADLMVKGYVPCIPLSEHQPYDLIAVLPDGKAIKIQVKYASLKKNGTIEMKFKTSWADKKGNHANYYKVSDFDYHAIYCPEKEAVLYVPNNAKCPTSIRFDETANRQDKYVKWASDFLDVVR